jgi:8-oxoguanine deaminase
MTSSQQVVLDGCAIATVDDSQREFDSGHIVIEDDMIIAVGEGAGPDPEEGGLRIDASGCLATPGLVNCHHHLYQWLTRGLAQESNLFEWLTTLYPIWARIDAELVGSAARAALVALARSGCTTTTDHQYVFPRDGGDILAAEIEAAREVGLRFHPCRGSMDLGASRGGLPPDSIVEDRDEILSATEAAINTWHDSSPGSMVQIAVAPCSPFSATRELMAESAELARKHKLRLHTHLAETKEEEEDCLDRFGVKPVELLDELGWLGDDVWLAHCVHLSDADVQRFGATGTGVAHCPSSNARLGAGIAPVTSLLQAGAPVGLGVDGAASNEAGELNVEMRGALLAARARGGASAITARQALALATREGARCLGRLDEIGTLEAGKLADIALWKLDDLGHAGIADPVAAFVLGPPRPVYSLLVGGRSVIGNGWLETVDLEVVTSDAATASARLMTDAGAAG